MTAADGLTTSTTVLMKDWLGQPQWSSIIHRVDLSDLGEPYLSAVKEARRIREKNA